MPEKHQREGVADMWRVFFTHYVSMLTDSAKPATDKG